MPTMTPEELNDLCEKRLTAMKAALNACLETGAPVSSGPFRDDAAAVTYKATDAGIRRGWKLRFDHVIVELQTGRTLRYSNGPDDCVTGVAVQCVYPHDSDIRSVNTKFTLDALGTVLGLSQEKVAKIHEAVMKANGAFVAYVALKAEREAALDKQIAIVQENAPSLVVAGKLPMKGVAVFNDVGRATVTVNTEGRVTVTTRASVPARHAGEVLRLIEQLDALGAE